MHRFFLQKAKARLGVGRRVGGKYRDINPEDIFLDSANLPGFEEHALQGRIERRTRNSVPTALYNPNASDIWCTCSRINS